MVPGPLVLIRVCAVLAAAAGLLAGCGTRDSQKIAIGVKFDQPGLSIKNPDGQLSGFDVDVARYVAGRLGYPPDRIAWIEAPSGQREMLLRNRQVDYIVATYSITDARRKKVDFAGPYLIAGQSLLVRADNTDITGAASLEQHKKLCSVSGSTPAQRIKEHHPGVQLQRYDTYSGRVTRRFQGSLEEWQAMGVLNYEMESATLFTMCASQGLRAGCVAGVLVNRTQQETPDEETAKRIESTSVAVVVEAARDLVA